MARMQSAKRRRATGATAVSLVVHLLAGVALLSQRPAVVAEEPIISVLLVSRPPPPTGANLDKPAPLRLHRPQPVLPPDVPTAPIAPPAPPGPAATPAPAPSHGPVALHPSPLPEGPKGQVRTALRHSYVGCANPDVVGLNRAERDFCDEKLGKGARDAKFAGLGLSADKQRLLDAAGARKEADYRYKHTTPVPLGPPSGPGATAEQMCQDLGVPPDECAVHMRK
jgi:hypothetical protein